MREVIIPAGKLLIATAQFAIGSPTPNEYMKRVQDFCRELGLHDDSTAAMSVARQIGEALQSTTQYPVCTNQEIKLYTVAGDELLSQIVEFLGHANRDDLDKIADSLNDSGDTEEPEQ